MLPYEMSQEEKEYLEKYQIADYERPSVAADVVVLSVLKEGEREDIRKLQEKKLKILLIKRASYPYRDCWALPGGFCIPGEDVEETARRELKEETNVQDTYLKLIGSYGGQGRDPRGWIISNTFLALMDGMTCELRAGSDAWEARWFSVEIEEKEQKKHRQGQQIRMETEYELTLTNEETGIVLKSEMLEEKVFWNCHATVRYSCRKEDAIAFDHSRIILDALLCLRKEVERDMRIGFDLMPERFTLTELQKTFELIYGKKLVTANFRRKIQDLVLETEEILTGEGFRPARLHERNVEAFY